MTDEPALPPEITPDAVEPSRPAVVSPAEPAPPRKSIALPLAVIALVLGVFAVGWAWRTSEAANAEVATLQDRIATLEQKPAPPSLEPVESRLAALEKRPVPDMGRVDQRLTTLENKPPPVAVLDNAGHTEIAALAGRVDQITARQTQLGTQEQTDYAKLTDALAAQDKHWTDTLAAQEKRLGADVAAQNASIAATAAATGQVNAATAKAGQAIDALAGQQARTAQLGAAAVALEAGRPLGAIPNAPPALAQFATKAPPTEATLRLSFDQAAAAAQEASRPAPSDKPLWDRMLARAQSTILVKQGDRVVLGSEVSSYLTAARHQLDAGDLAGAVAALNGLDGSAAAAMAPWRQQAQSLLDARAALLTAAHG